MSGPKRMSPLYIVFAMLRMLRTLVPVAVLFAVQFIAGNRAPGFALWILGVGVLLVVLTGLVEILGWKKFTYEEEGDRITIRKGLIQRSEKIIYYSRIHSVSQEQPLIQRILGVVQLKIETPGGSGDGDAVLPVLPRREAERLQRALNERAADHGAAAEPAAAEPFFGPAGGAEGQEPPAGFAGPEQGASGAAGSFAPPDAQAGESRRAEGGALPQEAGTAAAGRSRAARAPEPELLYRLGPGRLFLAALTEMNLGLAVAFVAGIFSFADDLLPDEWMNRLVTNAQAYLTGFRAILIIAAVALIAAWLLSLVLFIVKYAGFSLYREGERLSIRYGLLERKQFLFHPGRVQAVTIREGWLRQALGYAHVELNVVSSAEEKETPALHPFIARAKIEELLSGTIPQFRFAGAEFRPPKRAWWGYTWIGLVVTVVIAAVLIYFFPYMGRWALLLIPASLGIDYWSYRTSGATLEDDRLMIVNRTFAKQTHCTLKRHIVALHVGGSRWQRKGEMLNVKAHLLGGSGGSSISVARLKHSDAGQIYEWYRRKK
ncbi:hypothetical protein CDO73_03350 [Saccharibacillus sp. O23]|uniref:PH domain-containing protein n=1 Tax=Saccharibacillus sp. O23 TaxID=2009338 RepID=UPI000B4DFE47|nr:PH domain-containing protein [Saccharibacillus sp. O23]OWR32649.1 hypothetical protein CDO73_03350 [Saccharibacillus sp. O23]